MHKVDSAGATGSNEFTDGDPAIPTPATVLAEKWHNTVQRELVYLVETAGLTLSDSNDTQVDQAVRLIATQGVVTSRESLENGRLYKSSVTALAYGAKRAGIQYFIVVNDEEVDLSTPLTVATTANLVSATGTDSGGAPSASTLYSVYVSNSQSTFSPLGIRLSATTPTNGYLGASGDAAHWRHIGNVYLDGSTQIADDWNVGYFGTEIFNLVLASNITRSSGGAAYYDIDTMQDVACVGQTKIHVCAMSKQNWTTSNPSAKLLADAVEITDEVGQAGVSGFGVGIMLVGTFEAATANEVVDFIHKYNYDGTGTLAISADASKIVIIRSSS